MFKCFFYNKTHKFEGLCSLGRDVCVPSASYFYNSHFSGFQNEVQESPRSLSGVLKITRHTVADFDYNLILNVKV